MSASKPQRSRRAVLGEDGEIQDLDNLLNGAAVPQLQPERDGAPSRAMQSESIYCVRCGTANIYDASYCARCGKALIEPGMTTTATGTNRETSSKGKRDWQTAIEAEPMAGPQFDLQRRMNSQLSGQYSQFNIWSVISRVVMLTFMTGMVITSIAVNRGHDAWLGVLALTAWFLVEAVQRGKHHFATLTSMITEVITMVFVGGIVVASMAANEGNNAWLAVIALAAWFLVEAVRT